MIRVSFKSLRSRRRTVGILGTIGGMMNSSRGKIATIVRATYRMFCPASTIWISMANGWISPIMGGSGVPAALVLIGRRIVTVIGGGVMHMAGPGFHLSRGAGSRIIMGDGHIKITAGAGCPARNFTPAGRGVGPRIWLPFLGGAIERIIGAKIEIAMVIDGWGGVRLHRVRRVKAAMVSSITSAGRSTLYATTVLLVGLAGWMAEDSVMDVRWSRVMR